MENTILDVGHDVAELGVNTPISQEERISPVTSSDNPKTNGNAGSTASAKSSSASKLLTGEQEKMVRSLNTIPNMKKYRAFFTEVRNSHAIIISRDPRRFAIHEKGVEVLEHWSERFEL